MNVSLRKNANPRDPPKRPKPHPNAGFRPFRFTRITIFLLSFQPHTNPVEKQ